MIVYSSWFPFGKNTDAIALWPFIFVRKGRKWNEYIERHERIHLRQQIELLLVGFYLLYAILWMFKGDNNPFEKEAYNGQWQEDYLQKRKFWEWTSYIKD
jgi:hypothetical protein